VLTSHRARATWASRLAALIGATITIIVSAAAVTPARAEDLDVTNCVGGFFSTYNCVSRWGQAGNTFVREVPEPIDAAEQARREAGDRKWMARCHPAIQHDRLGVSRYRYSAPGCEFGVTED
jgi:hypothetical protein